MPDMSWIHTENGLFVDEVGIPVCLRGCNLGNWFLLETWMLDMKEIPDQYSLERILTTRFGEKEKKRLMDLYRANWITERDFENIASYGFNVVRLPFHYSLLEDDRKPMVMKQDGLDWLDRAVDMAARKGLYVVLDLHGAQGGQSTDHTTGRSGNNQLWSNPDNKKRCCWLWQSLAAHFKDYPNILAYDVLNEPYGDSKDNRHEIMLAQLFDELYAAIRTEDERHIILAPGVRAGVEFYGDPREKGWKQVGFTEHFYPGLFGEKANMQSHVDFIQRKLPWRAHYFKTMNMPLLVGEFQTVFSKLGGGGALMRYYYDLYNEYGWAATMWSYKLLSKQGGMSENSWAIVSNLKPMPLVNITDSDIGEIEELFTWFGTMDYCTNQNLVVALQSEYPPPLDLPEIVPLLLEAPKADPLPAGWTSLVIGNGLPGGQQVNGPDALTVYGSGSDIWDVRDAFYFVSRSIPGDFSFTATLDALGNTHHHAKAGLMLRTSNAPDAAHLLLTAFPDGYVTIGWRAEKGRKMDQINLDAFSFPIQFSLVRKNGIAELSCSSPGKKRITKKIKLSPDFNGKCSLGLAVCSRDAHYLTEAVFSDIRLTR